MENDERTNRESDIPSVMPTEPAPIPLPIPEAEANLGNDNYNMGTDKPKYYCPMHCEGDKTYEQPGECPVCGMRLEIKQE